MAEKIRPFIFSPLKARSIIFFSNQTAPGGLSWADENKLKSWAECRIGKKRRAV